MTDRMESSVLFLFTLSLLVGQFNCSIIRFTASPSVIKTNLTSFASMRCSLTDTDPHTRSTTNTSTDVTRLSSITIRRNNGQEVVFATPFDPPTAMVDQGNLQVKGDVTGTSSEGYVELTWSDASAVALGEYVCEVSTFAAGHHTLVFTATLELTSVTPSISDLITELKTVTQRQQQQDTEMIKQKQQISNLEQENSNHKLEMTNQKQQISQLERLNSNQQQEISILNSTVDRLSRCASTRVGFMAVLSRGGQNGITFAANQRVVFDKVITNEDGAYNSQTGKFVCSTAGNYEFNVHAVGYSGTAVCLHLNVNSDSLTSLYSWADGHADSGSTSAVVKLQSGDEVYVMTAACSGGAKFYQDSNLWQNNVFTGQLVHADECVL